MNRAVSKTVVRVTPVPRVRIPPPPLQRPAHVPCGPGSRDARKENQPETDTLGSKKKTTFAKMSREAKLREKRHSKALRGEARQQEKENGEISHEAEDLSHLNVAVVEGVEPDVTVKR